MIHIPSQDSEDCERLTAIAAVAGRSVRGWADCLAADTAVESILFGWWLERSSMGAGGGWCAPAQPRGFGLNVGAFAFVQLDVRDSALFG